MEKLRISSMDSVAVDKAKLIKTLEVNRKKHVATYMKARVGWAKQSVKKLEQMLKNAKANKKFESCTDLEKPISHKEDYDRAIDMLKWCVDDIVNVSQSDYNEYVLDNWHWKSHFTSNTGRYR